MKLRIKGNSLRYRLTKSEVARLADVKYIEEATHLPQGTLLYSLQCKSGIDKLYADFTGNKITMYVPLDFVKDWVTNDVVGIQSTIPLESNGTLFLLLEKDFVCLDETFEDQSDNYDNPNKSC